MSTEADAEFLTVNEVASRLGLSNASVRRLIETGAVPAQMTGRTFRIPVVEFDAFLVGAWVAAQGDQT